MAKTIKYIFIILSAAYFMFAGTGYNIVKRCCKDCKTKDEQTSEPKAFNKKKYSLKNDCCKNKQSISYANTTCMAVKQHSMKCFFKRVTVDIPILQTLNDLLNYYIKQFDLFYTSTPDLKKNQQLVYENIYPPPNPSFLKTGRELLALKAVLII